VAPRSLVPSHVPCRILPEDTFPDEVFAESTDGGQIRGDGHGSKFPTVGEIPLVALNVLHFEPDPSVGNKPPDKLAERTLVCAASLRTLVPQAAEKTFEVFSQCSARHPQFRWTGGGHRNDLVAQ
jgi:hypothetical protein